MVISDVWSNLEPCLGIISACLPVHQPALARILGGNPLEWTRWSVSTNRSVKHCSGTGRWSSICCAKTDISSKTWPPLPPAHRTQSSKTNQTWPISNERRVVRFKDVEWGDYFPRRANTIPMSIFHCPGAERRYTSSEGPDHMDDNNSPISPCSIRYTATWGTYFSEYSGDSSQYWD